MYKHIHTSINRAWIPCPNTAVLTRLPPPVLKQPAIPFKRRQGEKKRGKKRKAAQLWLPAVGTTGPRAGSPKEMPSSHPAPVFVLQKWGEFALFFLWPDVFIIFFRIRVCFRQYFTSYLPINHIPSGVWGAGGRAAPYACSSVPVSLLPEEQTTSLEDGTCQLHKHTQTSHVSSLLCFQLQSAVWDTTTNSQSCQTTRAQFPLIKL